jgi:hypothetical protein
MCTGCAFAPKVSSDQPYATNCEMTTQMLTLDKPRATQAFNCQKQQYGPNVLSCMILGGIIIPAGSFIISGSIVLVNNSLHWLEYQGSCEKNEAQKKPKNLKTAKKTDKIATLVRTGRNGKGIMPSTKGKAY